MPDIAYPFAIEVMKGVNRAIAESEFDLLVYTTGDVRKSGRAFHEQKYVSLLTNSISDGVIIVVAKNDHKLRIEVGRGLEGAIPDIYAKRIIAENIAPLFKQGDMSGGLNAGVDKVIGLISGEVLPPPAKQSTHVKMSFENQLGLFIMASLFIGGFLSAKLGRFFGSGSTGLIMGGAASLFAGLGSGLFIGLAAFFFTLLIPILFGGRGLGGYYGGFGGGSSSGGSFSGGGGDFGGGGASGDW